MTAICKVYLELINKTKKSHSESSEIGIQTDPTDSQTDHSMVDDSNSSSEESTRDSMIQTDNNNPPMYLTNNTSFSNIPLQIDDPSQYYDDAFNPTCNSQLLSKKSLNKSNQPHMIKEEAIYFSHSSIDVEKTFGNGITKKVMVGKRFLDVDGTTIRQSITTLSFKRINYKRNATLELVQFLTTINR